MALWLFYRTKSHSLYNKIPLSFEYFSDKPSGVPHQPIPVPPETDVFHCYKPFIYSTLRQHLCVHRQWLSFLTSTGTLPDHLWRGGLFSCLRLTYNISYASCLLTSASSDVMHKLPVFDCFSLQDLPVKPFFCSLR